MANESRLMPPLGVAARSGATRFILGFWIVAAALTSLPVTGEAAKRLAKDGDLVAMVRDDFKCERRVRVWVLSRTSQTFRGDRVKLQRLMAPMRVAVEFQCPRKNVKEIIVLGQVNKKVIWRGFLSQNNNWVLAEMPLTRKRSTTTAKKPPQTSTAKRPTRPTRTAPKPSSKKPSSTRRLVFLPSPRQTPSSEFYSFIEDRSAIHGSF